MTKKQKQAEIKAAMSPYFRAIDKRFDRADASVIRVKDAVAAVSENLDAATKTKRTHGRSTK